MSPRSLVNAAKTRLDKLREPAPLNDFADYDEYWETRGRVGFIQHRWKVAAELIPDGATVLDVGCGSGQFLEYLREIKPNVIGTGCDLSQVAAEKTRARGFEAYAADLGSEDLRGVFDYVTCFEVVEHIPNAEDAIVRLLAATAKELIVSVPNLGYVDYRVRLAVFGRFPVTHCIYHMKEHVRHWTASDFVEWAQKYGGRVVDLHPQYIFEGSALHGLAVRWPRVWSPGLVYVLKPTRV